jgi:hypothetical protein
MKRLFLSALFVTTFVVGIGGSVLAATHQPKQAGKGSSVGAVALPVTACAIYYGASVGTSGLGRQTAGRNACPPERGKLTQYSVGACPPWALLRR